MNIGIQTIKKNILKEAFRDNLRVPSEKAPF
jgi:hypothetical protein